MLFRTVLLIYAHYIWGPWSLGTWGLKIGTTKFNVTADVPNSTVAYTTTTVSPTELTLSSDSAYSTSPLPKTKKKNITSFPPLVRKKAESTTTTPKTTSTTITEVKEQRTYPKIKGDLFCFCNLHLNVCDVNCCCDSDCSDEVFKVFDCYGEPNYPELTRPLDHIQYEPGLPSCHDNDGWLCVFRSNKNTAIPQAEPILNLDTTNRLQWPSLIQYEDREARGALTDDFYRFGDPIKLFNAETLELQNFELPLSILPPYCQLRDPIKHLKSMQTSCLVATPEELQANMQQLLQLVTATKLLVKPKRQQQIGDLTPYLKDIRAHRCRSKPEGSQQCVLVKNFSNASEELELYYTTKIVVKLLHNFTSILEVLVEFQERELREDEVDSFENNVPLWQTFQVQFIENAPLADTDIFQPDQAIKQLSGALGYLQGEPVIVTQLTASNSSHQPTLNYFHTSDFQAKRTLQLFTRRQQLCRQSAAAENRVNYGINVQKQCLLRLGNETAFNYAGHANYTATCVSLQRLVWQQLFDFLVDVEHAELDARFLWEQLTALHVSKLGRPQNSTDKWLNLELRNFEFAAMLGTFDQQARTFTCHNMLLSAAYTFHVGTFLEQHVPQQAMIKHAALTFGQLHDVQFALDEVVQVPLTVSVMFYDIASASGLFSNNNIALACALTILQIFY